MANRLRHIKSEKAFTVRNNGPEPFIEGCKQEPLSKPIIERWDVGLKPHDRLYKHATISSVRHRAQNSCASVPKDELDFVLEAIFDPVNNTFPEKSDPFLHMETVINENEEPLARTWRVLRNRLVIVPPKKPHRGHPIVYGGSTENESIFHVKLGIASDHSPQTNPGYSRTPTGSYYSI